ncbi:MAG: hypothetical protein CO144_01590 [Candidatus Nealsonbacteria bacterium CG_4_9_14_3_um_filter_35_11]|uniref:Uncharacterized protein n=2 Tax=Candidatus Nealsoniibacteriota TaxID=1817911 RepID=A0A2M7DAC7_9BACT|nr:MAG: hypothetical protein COV62_02135 [Candidatus Nealsonbacteria bacterium CG11_big_fil_rev_8_21_14_0_20_35_11]PIV45403.1 MAG: hypothetical protein COS24_02455 [Candidatus Nealsonbacteria bacterium CG02_land_8_20_14_3_00_34_20]PIW92669.1 MAG: hypothetical protein COZ88_00945 [Candidatus Nealsonbacteria bacterium CG_4_8_14_3_um_filter_34_13]PIZ90065.1 MAG: hypothetical protein COX88_00395 [Candidatus Nealsonbacteria bacterium CG_4_10_14_0_2_um_filter_35_20]PJA84465.1 MAG: hypothetical protei
MNFEPITQIILLCSFFSIVGLVLWKIPILVALPESIGEKREESLVLKFKRKFKELNPFKNFSLEIFLQKVLSKIRILSLRTDNKTSNWLQKLREKTKKKVTVFPSKPKRHTKEHQEDWDSNPDESLFKDDDNYWKEIKNSIKK